MKKHRAIDLVIMPFTHGVKRDVYSSLEEVRGPMTKLGGWNRSFSPESLLEKMDKAGIVAVLMAAQAAGEWEVPYDVVEEVASKCDGRVMGMAGIDPRRISVGVHKMAAAITERGFVGAHSYPHWFGLRPDDRAYYPFYDKCVELDVPVQIQTGQCNQRSKTSVGYPSSIDAIAVDFPDLKIVAIHTGYPWERELVGVCRKHPNVYIGGDDHPATDWAADIKDFVRADGRQKVLFGTNYPAMEFSDALDAIEGLSLEKEREADLLFGNTHRVYRLPERLLDS